MIDWDNMTDAQLDARNQEAWDVCSQLLREALARNSDLDLDGAKSLVEADMIAERRECERLIKRGARSRASKTDRWVADSARQRNEHLGFDMGMLWDVEVEV